TYTATVSGTYYLRARSSGGSWSTCSSTWVTVNPFPSTPPVPVSSTNSCGSKTLTRATPPSGVTYYWQGTSCGTSTANSSLNYSATATGTYYLKARSNAGCWSSCSSTSVSVTPEPPTPPTPSASTNGCGTIVLTRGNPPAGVVYYWQGTSCGTSTTNSANTFNATTSGNYYLRALNSQGCWSSCASKSVTIIPCPANLTASFISCPAGQVVFNWSNASSNWSLEVSLDPAFNSYHAISVSNATTITGPTGFTPTFFFQPNATYYWRISAGGGSFVNGPIFNVPFCDLVVPTTSVDPITGWQNADFTASFTDADNIAVGKGFYRVLDFDGTEWLANPDRGFFNDNFDNSTLSSQWASYVGTWSNSLGFLVQSDDSENNTILSAPLTQNLSNRYLYHWNAKIEGSGTNRRAGLHFFCDDPSLPNRGNSYFVWFRLDDNKLQFYKVINEVYTQVKSVDYTFNASEYYDFKLIYDRITGKMDIYINNILAESWVDANPIASGDYVSFRTGNATMNVNYFKAFRSRYPSTTVNVGSGNTNDMRFENAAPTIAGGKIESVVSDREGNLSMLSSIAVNLDWTPPSVVSIVNDGPGPDISTTYLTNELTANWAPSADPNSGVVKYYYSIGTAPGLMDLLGWTDNFLQLMVVNNALSLVLNETYYFNVRAENGAGIFSSISSSDGQMVIVNSTDINEENPVIGLNIYPNPFNNTTTLDYSLLKNQKVRIAIYDLTGREIALLKNEDQMEGNHKIKIDGSQLSLAEGMYLVTFKTPETSVYFKIIFKK
ncbi:MAG: T9SS type A sorting domain-containing protein, partial [Bacteroidota bacterium]|nr:T9SS type A sorting domain-containing protein [Bacteroidota bacterium]